MQVIILSADPIKIVFFIFVSNYFRVVIFGPYVCDRVHMCGRWFTQLNNILPSLFRTPAPKKKMIISLQLCL